jgi:hypothetical protein
MVRSATPRRGAILLVFALVAIAGPVAGQGADRPVVAVVDVTGRDDGRALARVAHTAIARQVTRRALAEPLAVLLTGPRTDEGAAAIADAGRALALARDAVAHFDRATAVRQVNAGVASLVTVAPSSETTALLAELLFAEGLAHATDGDVAAATTAFAAVRRLDPARQIDPRTYLPDVVRAFTAAGRPVASAPLTVRVTGGQGVEVWVDGVLAGPAPRVVTVAAGAHVVSATGPEVTTTGARVMVTGGAATIDLVVMPAPLPVQAARWRRRLAAASDDTSRAAALDGLARLIGVGEIVMIVDRGGGLGLRVWYRGATAPGPVHASDGAIPPGVLPGSLPPPTVTAGRMGDGRPRRGDRDDGGARPWWQRRWVQATAAGGALVVVAGVVTALALRSDDTSMLGPVEPE